MNRHTAVIGGGIVGGFCAWYLRNTGRDVTIVDAGRFGAGCSHGNCGYICPSHVLPLPGPGQLRKVIRGMLTHATPLRIPIRWSPSLWVWLLQFARNCNRPQMLRAGAARHGLLQSSMTEYRRLTEDGTLHPEWRSEGLLYVCREERTLGELQQKSELLARDFGVTSRHFAPDQLSDREPVLRSGLAGAIWFDGDAHVRPDRLMESLREVLQREGVSFEEDCRIRSIQSSRQNVAAAVTADNGREMAADEFVFATGALTPFLNNELGCGIPIQPGKGYSITMSGSSNKPRGPMILEECHVALTPFAGGCRIGSTMEFSGYNSELNPRRLQYLRDGAEAYLQEPVNGAVEEEWCGWRPMTADGLPYIDRTPKYANVWLAAGHNMIGMSTAPATGRLISELLTGTAPHIDPHPFRIR